MIAIGFSAWHSKPHVIVNDVFVDPKFRRTGVGSALLLFVRDYAHEIGCCRVDLFVESNNLSACRFDVEIEFTRLMQSSYSMPIDPADGLP